MTLSSRNRPPIGNSAGLQNDGEILNRCLEAVLLNRATIEDCVRKYPAYGELGILLQAALTVQKAPKVTLSPLGKSELRQRILAHYDAQPIRKLQRPRNFDWRGWLRPFVAVATTFIVLFAGSASLIHAASLAVPGDTLYGLKRATERIQLSLADNQSRTATLDQIANTRLNELTILVSRNNSLPDAVLNDASVSISQALKAEPNAAKRASLLDKTADVMLAAAKVGAIDPTTETEILTAIQDGSTGDGTNPSGNTGDHGKATKTATPTETVTATPTATLTATPTLTETPDTPTITPSAIDTDVPDAVDNAVPPEPSDPPAVPAQPIHPIHPTHPPTPVPPNPPAGNGNGNGNGGGGGNGNGHGH